MVITQNIKAFHESINQELLVVKNRVENLIGDAHRGENGRYREVVLRNVISRFLPKKYSIGTGFVINGDKKVTKQIDIIIYDDSSPVLFREGDFVIVLANTVWATISVKSKITSMREVKKCIRDCEENASKIYREARENDPFFKFFNGIFVYECAVSFENLENSLKTHFFTSNLLMSRKVNNISLGKDKFLHLFSTQQSLKCYELKDLSFAYFISNILSTIDSNPIQAEHSNLYFPFYSKTPFLKFSISSTTDV